MKDKSAETDEPASTPEEASDFLSKGALNLWTWTCTPFLLCASAGERAMYLNWVHQLAPFNLVTGYDNLATGYEQY